RGKGRSAGRRSGRASRRAGLSHGTGGTTAPAGAAPRPHTGCATTGEAPPPALRERWRPRAVPAPAGSATLAPSVGKAVTTGVPRRGGRAGAGIQPGPPHVVAGGRTT